MKPARLLRGFFVVIFTIVICSPFKIFHSNQVWAANVSWDGGASTTAWEDALNWSTDTVPTDADDVVIDVTGTIDISSGTTVNSLVLGNGGGTTSPVLNFTYDAVGTSSPFVVDDGNLFIYSGGSITHSAGTSVVVGSVNIDVQTGNMIVSSGGSVDASGKGFANAQGPGAGDYGYAGSGGGGYGGNGGDGDTSGSSGGVAYGSINNPVDLGSGSGNTTKAGTGVSGGGLVKLNVSGELSLDGNILANGTVGKNASWGGTGGGSGGSVNITVGTISGIGNITSNGGNGGNSNADDGGGGGGGRISISYITNTLSGTVNARGGTASAQEGGAGTVYLYDGSGNGDVIIDNGGIDYGAVTPLGASGTFDSVEAKNNSLLLLNGIVDTGVFTVTDAGLETNSSTNVTSSSFTTSGSVVLRDNGGNFPYFSSGTSDLSIPVGTTYYANTARTYANGVVDGVITHDSNNSSHVYDMDLTFTGNLTISSGGSIDVSGKGFSGTQGPGAGSDGEGSGGGAYGGDGGDGISNIGGTAYGSETNPVDLGSGSGNSVKAGDGVSGGGLSKLNIAGELSVAGNILSNGTIGKNDLWGATGGGAGGTLDITVDTISGTGNITANGGNGGSAGGGDFGGGGGGGGRIVILYNTSSFSGTLTATGGTASGTAGYGEDGTVSYLATNQTPTLSVGDIIFTEGAFYAGNVSEIVTKYTDPDGKADLDSLYLDLSVEGVGTDIEYYANEVVANATDQVPTEVLGSEYVESITYDIYPVSEGSYIVDANEIIVVWHVTTDWDWIDDSNIEIGIRATDDSAADSGYVYTTSDYQYENDLTFTGVLTSVAATTGVLSSGDWVLPEEEITWSGLKVVYQGEIDVYPQDSDFNVTVTDDDSNIWIDGISSGENFNVVSTSQLTTTSEDIHTITITDIPSGGSDISNEGFTIKVDATNPSFVSLESSSHPDEDGWYSSNIVTYVWEASDEESGISQFFTFLSTESNLTEAYVLSNGTATSELSLTTDALEDGVWYFYNVVEDSVGNSSMDQTTVQIDASVPNIVAITGEYNNVWQNVDDSPTIGWTDPSSISNDMFYITVDGTDPSSNNFAYATNQTSYTISSLGEDEHTVKVVAKNGAGTYSIVREFVVKYDTTPTSTVTNLSATVSSTNKVTVSWINPVDSDFDRVIVLRKTGSVSTSPSDGTQIYEGTGIQYVDIGLSSSTTYYYSVYAYDRVDNLSEVSSTHVTTRDLVSPSGVDDFKAVQVVDGISLEWINPSNGDFSSVELKRDGETIYKGGEESYIDEITEEGTYVYTIVAYDTSGNISEASSLEVEYVIAIEEDEDDGEQSEKIVVSESEIMGVKISVKKVLGDMDLDEIDKVVLAINDQEYEMTLSEDNKYFFTTAIAPDKKGEHVMSAMAMRGSDIVGQYDIDFTVEALDEPSSVSNIYVYILGGLFLLSAIIFIVVKIRKKKLEEDNN